MLRSGRISFAPGGPSSAPGWRVIVFAGRIAVTWLGDHIPVIATIIISTLGLLATVSIAVSQLRRVDRTFRAQIFMQISDKWSVIYPQRNRVLNSEPTTLKQLQEKYAGNYRPFLASEEWNSIREVCNFFEFLGVILHEGFIEAGPLFALVTVEDAEGKTSGNLGPYIAFLRKHYRPDVYEFYDYLLGQYEKHKGMRFSPNAQRRVFDPE
jgi:hypothetical protein